MIKNIWFRNFACYLPSLMSRYSIQLMLVALPWILQNRGVSMLEISATLGFFYAGSLIMGILSTRIINRLNAHRTLQILIIAQSLLAGAVFLTTDITMITFLRFFHGIALGLLRPLNQIWLLEVMVEDVTAEQRAKRASYSQVVIALGMAVGSFLGSLAPQFSQGLIYAISVCVLPAFLATVLMPKGLNQNIHKEQSQTQTQYGFVKTFHWLSQHGTSVRVILIYLFSLTVLKLWMVTIPVVFRDSPKYTDSEVAAFLGLILAVQPLAFSLGQYLMGIMINWLPKSQSVALHLVGIATILQGLLTWASLATSNFWIIGLLIIVGGGMIPAAIYPIMSLITMRDFQNEPASLKRQIMLILGISADVGQIIGTFLLALPLLTKIPMETMILPIGIVLILMAFELVSSKRTYIARQSVKQ